MAAHVTYTGLRQPARCVQAVLGDTERNRFAVGTCSLVGEPNELHMVEYDPGADRDEALHCAQIFAHSAGEVLCIAPCPTDPALLCTAHNQAGCHGVTLWSTAGAADGTYDAQPLESRSTLRTDGDDPRIPIRAVMWSPSGDLADGVITADCGKARHWQVDADSRKPTETTCTKGDGTRQITSAAWDAHHAKQVAVARGEAIFIWDLRIANEGAAPAVRRAHVGCCRDIDYNPNKPYSITTGGDDGRICGWDLRKAGRPLFEQTAHQHWVWMAKYNRFHDQLILTASSDSTVALWSAVSASSDAALSLADAAELEPAGESVSGTLTSLTTIPAQIDGLIAQYEYHEDSVYSVAWAAVDPWVFASVSHDGRLVVNQVSQEEKDKILL